ncbi:hypothetical protein E1B28_005345 [Marasmius oreades]|nr:uncharacterized protein E1B28_005345 [Marasmius oreades]KAG7094514.1 hypothetical protein E1B28_005345 [Marasmius oreades]
MDLEKLVESFSASESDLCSRTASETIDDAEESGQEEEREELLPIWDGEERIYRCVVCGWEIIERECQKPECGEKYSDYVCQESPDGIPLDESDRTFHLCDDSYLLPSIRSITPLLDIDPARLHPETVAYGFEGRLYEYEALLTRGATRLMCETFNLSYSDETGIVLEMKDPDLDDLFQEWAGDRIVSSECESWKIFLGREIHLADDDVDGSEYVNDFLEDALLFDRDSSVQWKTTEVRTGAWETKGDLSEGRDDCENVQNDGTSAQVGSDNEADCDGDEREYDTDENGTDEEKPLTSTKEVARNEYESDGIEDECVTGESRVEYGVESDRDEDSFWGSDDGRYKYDSANEGDVTEEYETDPPDTEEESEEENHREECEEQ